MRHAMAAVRIESERQIERALNCRARRQVLGGTNE
jgi:hypothetical protein